MSTVPVETLAVTFAYCPLPGQVDLLTLHLPPGSTLAAGLVASGLLQRHGLQLADISAGIWGRKQPLETQLRDRDRVELYRPLQVDPKEARRLRYGSHKAAAEARDQVKKQRALAAAAEKLDQR